MRPVNEDSGKKFADKVTKATQEAFEKGTSAAEKAGQEIEQSYSAAAAGIRDFNLRVMEMVQANSQANFDFAREISTVLGMWAAEKLGMTGRDAEAYADALAVGTLDPERSDVFSKLRADFDAAGVVQSDDQILRVMSELTLEAGNQMPAARGDASDALAVVLARQLKSE
jgi:hypothetical protein